MDSKPLGFLPTGSTSQIIFILLVGSCVASIVSFYFFGFSRSDAIDLTGKLAIISVAGYFGLKSGYNAFNGFQKKKK